MNSALKTFQLSFCMCERCFDFSTSLLGSGLQLPSYKLGGLLDVFMDHERTDGVLLEDHSPIRYVALLWTLPASQTILATELEHEFVLSY